VRSRLPPCLVGSSPLFILEQCGASAQGARISCHPTPWKFSTSNIFKCVIIFCHNPCRLSTTIHINISLILNVLPGLFVFFCDCRPVPQTADAQFSSPLFLHPTSP